MFSIVVGIAIFGVTQTISGIIWAIRLEAKTDVIEQRHADLKELINSRFDDSDQRLERIERSMNGFLRRN